MVLKNLGIAFLLALGICGAAAAAYRLLEIGGRGPASQPQADSCSASIGSAVQDLGERLKRVERRLEGSGEAPAVAREAARDPGVASTGEEDPVEERLSRLEAGFESLALRLEALEEDPIGRAYAYIDSDSPELRREGVQLLERLARFDPEARKRIRNLLRDPEPRVRFQALDALGDIKDQESAADILHLLADPEATIRRGALDAIGDMKAEAAADAVARHLLAETEARVRQEAAEVLGELRSPAGVEALIQALRDPSAEVQGEAIASLGEIGAAAAAPHLRALWESDPGPHRLRLARALQRFGDEGPFQSEVERLSTAALSSPDQKVREEAIADLARFARETAGDVFMQALQDPSPGVRRAARRALE